ncbi:MAG: PfkB family carbohydrate kinase, partial [Acidilobaceae archaeon]
LSCKTQWHVAVGNVNVDVSLTLDSYPEPGSNVVATGLWIGIGGAAVNYAALVSRWGYKASVVSIVNPLAVKLGILEELQRLGIDISYVRVVEGEPNIAVILMSPGESLRTIISYRGASRTLEGFMIPPIGDHIHFASTPGRVIVEAREALKGKTSSYDPGGEVSRDPRGVLEAIGYVDWIFVNERELRKLTSSEDTGEAGKLLRGRTRMLIVKRGPWGATVISKETTIEAGAPRINKIADVTGTGDAFNAAFNIIYKETGNTEKALKTAVTAGALKATLRGSSTMPERELVEKHMPP